MRVAADRLDEPQSLALLAALVGALAPGGLVVFTSHGEGCVEHLWLYGKQFVSREAAWRAALAAGGMCDAPYHDERPAWGVALHSRAFVERTMTRLPAQLVGLQARGWDDHQDVWAYRRSA